MAKKCMKCGGSTTPKMAKGGMPTKVLGPAKKPFAAGIPFFTGAGQTGPEYMKKGGAMGKAKFGSTTPVKASCKKGEVRSASGGCVSERPKFAKGGFPDLNKDGKVTKADILKGRGVIKKIGGSVKKYQNGGTTKPAAKPKPKYVYGDVPGIGGPAAGQAATPGETILMDQKLAAEKKAKAAAAKRKAQATKKGK